MAPDDEDAEDANTDGVAVGDQGRDCLGVEEMTEALGALTSVDIKRLNRATEMLCRDIAMTPDDLVSEAIHAALSGRRLCPREVPVGIFLKGVVRSLASSARKSEARSKVVPYPGGTNERPNPIESARDGAANPEQVLLDKAEVQPCEDAAEVAARMLSEHFSADYEVQLCLAGMMDGMAGKELREFTGLDQAGLDYARKKIYRAKTKLFPRGWRNVSH